VRSLLQRNFQVVAQVGATVHLWTRGCAHATAKDVAEDIAEASANRQHRRRSRHRRPCWVDAGVTVAVIRIALLRIGQHLVGFFDFLELSSDSLLSGLRSGWYFIASCGRPFDLVFRSVFCDAEYLVKITLCHVVGTLQSIY
jgi:hypothetical protein